MGLGLVFRISGIFFLGGVRLGNARAWSLAEVKLQDL